jgi:hypothetical protein
MVAAAAALPRAPIAGIGRYHAGDQIVDFPIGWEETDRDAAWAREQLTRWGADRSWYALITAAAWQGPWVSPVLRACREIGITFGMADVFGWDSRRTATFARRLPLSMVFGLGRDTAEALADSGELADLLGGVPAILAHAGAVPVLTAAGLRPGLIAFLGPALALECPQRVGAHVNGAEWLVEETGDGLSLTTVAQRAYQAERVPLAIAGSVISGPCPCGSPDPRVRLS